ncbi:MAG: DNA repair protein RadA [Lachnospiraceae bacterium]|jgi:DNA repair protein RadA/Sms
MAKARDTAFFCKECGYESSKWTGQCPVCKEWNTMVEAPSRTPLKAQVRKPAPARPAEEVTPMSMSEISSTPDERICVGIGELDRVLGGGIIKDSLVLVGGDPGIGKSTLLTQVCRELGNKGIKVLYISGEESLHQIKMRADRLGEFNDNVKLLCETDLDVIESVISREMPRVCIIDSIQTMYRPDVAGAPGSIGQVRESTAMLLQMAKGMGIAIFIVGHVTKEGMVAGPRMLEHMVDTVLYFEGESRGMYRILRGVKNRFGPTNEIGVFEMCREGLKEVKNPSEFLLLGRPKDASGSVVSCSTEGTRQILVEIQALVSKTVFGNPRRSATGIDYNRLNLLIAVLEKRMGLRMSEIDVYVNVAGGLKINEPALDLAVIIALASGCMDFVVPQDTIAFGEVGLAGEVRNVSQAEARANEAAKLGFSTCILPKASLKGIRPAGDIRLIGVENVRDAIIQAQERK